jgi:TRAP-type C4-dicarboxylate transport system substrate-binding protein
MRRALVLAAAVLLVAGCGGRAPDKAGGDPKLERRHLTLAYVTGAPSALDALGHALHDVSGGALEVGYREGWRHGQRDYEAQTIRDVAAGRLDMAAVGARAFDRVGVTSFQPLLAPLLVDSYALEREVFEAGIPQRMLAGVAKAGVVGIAVLPGPMRKLLGVSRPLRAPADLAGQTIGMQDSALAAMTLKALGAVPRAVPSEASLAGLDGYEQQLDSIAGNQYDLHAKSVTAGVNLWPRPVVVVMSRRAYASLSAPQRAVLARAAKAAIGAAIELARNDDAEALTALCNRGIAFEHADVDAFRTAVAGVVPRGPVVEQIARLKAAVAAPAESPTCDSASALDGLGAATLPRGTFETTITLRDADGDAGLVGRFRMTIGARELTIGEAGDEPEFRATYSAYRDHVTAVSPEDTVKARFSYADGLLRFSDVHAPKPYVVTWASHPWRRVHDNATPLDGRYEFTTTKADLDGVVPARDITVENYGRQRWTLRAGRFRFDQRNGPTCETWTTGTFTVRGHTLTFRIEDAGGRTPHGTGAGSWLPKPGEVWTYRWSLYRDRLTLRPAPGEISPEPLLAKPWRKVGS